MNTIATASAFEALTLAFGVAGNPVAYRIQLVPSMVSTTGASTAAAGEASRRAARIQLPNVRTRHQGTSEHAVSRMTDDACPSSRDTPNDSTTKHSASARTSTSGCHPRICNSPPSAPNTPATWTAATCTSSYALSGRHSTNATICSTRPSSCRDPSPSTTRTHAPHRRRSRNVLESNTRWMKQPSAHTAGWLLEEATSNQGPQST